MDVGRCSVRDDRLPSGVTGVELRVLGPLTLVKARFAPEGYSRKMAAELWFLPDGTRVLELSTSRRGRSFHAEAETKVYRPSRNGPRRTAGDEDPTTLAALAARFEEEEP